MNQWFSVSVALTFMSCYFGLTPKNRTKISFICHLSHHLSHLKVLCAKVFQASVTNKQIKMKKSMYEQTGIYRIILRNCKLVTNCDKSNSQIMKKCKTKCSCSFLMERILNGNASDTLLDLNGY